MAPGVIIIIMFELLLFRLYEKTPDIPRHISRLSLLEHAWGILILLPSIAYATMEFHVDYILFIAISLFWLVVAYYIRLNKKAAKIICAVLSILRLLIPILGWIFSVISLWLLWKDYRLYKKAASTEYHELSQEKGSQEKS